MCILASGVIVQLVSQSDLPARRGEKFRVTGTGGPKEALRFLEAGIKAYAAEQEKS